MRSQVVIIDAHILQVVLCNSSFFSFPLCLLKLIFTAVSDSSGTCFVIVLLSIAAGPRDGQREISWKQVDFV